MSKKDNHRYLLDTLLGAWWRGMRRSAGLAWIPVVVVVLAVVVIPSASWRALLGGDGLGNDGRLLLYALPVLAGAAFFGLARWRVHRTRARFLEGLQAPDPDAVIELIDRDAARASVLLDADAFGAHTKAIVQVFYGREAEAVRTLAGVHWGSRAALVQGAGLAAEGLMETFCRHDPERALVLHRRSRELSAVGAGVPGAAQSDRFHAACLALAEVALGAATSDNTAALEQGYADARFPLLQLLSAFGLAVAVEAAGDAERARRLRAFIHQVAPHCTPLHFVPGADAVEVPVAASVREARPVTASIAAGGNAAAVAEVGRVTTKIAVRPTLLIGLVIVVLVLVVLQLVRSGH
jgi:hypothetical protein